MLSLSIHKHYWRHWNPEAVQTHALWKHRTTTLEFAGKKQNKKTKFTRLLLFLSKIIPHKLPQIYVKRLHLCAALISDRKMEPENLVAASKQNTIYMTYRNSLSCPGQMSNIFIVFQWKQDIFYNKITGLKVTVVTVVQEPLEICCNTYYCVLGLTAAQNAVLTWQNGFYSITQSRLSWGQF